MGEGSRHPLYYRCQSPDIATTLDASLQTLPNFPYGQNPPLMKTTVLEHAHRNQWMRWSRSQDNQRKLEKVAVSQELKSSRNEWEWLSQYTTTMKRTGWYEIQNRAFYGGRRMVRKQQLEARRTYPTSIVSGYRPVGENTATLWEGCRERSVLRAKTSFWARRREECSEKRLEIRFCWWYTINSTRHRGRVQELGKAGKRGQDEEVQTKRWSPVRGPLRGVGGGGTEHRSSKPEKSLLLFWQEGKHR